MAARRLDKRLEIVTGEFVNFAIDVKERTGIGEPEFTTALARALLFRVAVIAKPGTERAMLDDILHYLDKGLKSAIKQVAEISAEFDK